jgi:hypothetical protein
MPELAEVLVNSYKDPDTGAPILKHVQECIDWKSWLEPCRASMTNVTRAHQYVFQLQEVDGREQCVITCKQFAASPDETTTYVGTLLKVRNATSTSSSDPKPFWVL